MSAIVMSGVPAWYEVSGTTGSPGLTWRLSTVPDAGARITESTPPLTRTIFPSLVSASRSRARSSWILDWSNACLLASKSSLERIPSFQQGAVALEIGARPGVGHLGELDPALDLVELERRGVGGDGEQRLADLDPVARPPRSTP